MPGILIVIKNSLIHNKGKFNIRKTAQRFGLNTVTVCK